MQKIERYRDINRTMKGIKRQTIDSIDYAFKVCPVVNNPEELFAWLKPKLTFKADGKYKGENRELLQTMQTMFQGKIWGKPGLGDCDCFVITTLACMIRQNWQDFKIDLVGRKKIAPVHIYTSIYWKGERKVFDLTNPRINMERPYPYRQELSIPWKKWILTK